jgi:branched-chain amino acid transport system ATP-binding protein
MGVATAPRLQVEGLTTGYRRKQVVFDLSVRVEPGEIVALIGHNGAGKTTALKAIFGLLRVWSGAVVFEGQVITNSPPDANVRRGMAYIPQERAVFPDLTVAENLDLGGMTVPDPATRRRRLEEVFDLFPVLRERRRQRAGTLSGGEQRMLSLGIALMVRPRLLLVDELSLGLAPALVQRIMETIRQICRDQGISIMLVEQNVRQALRVADRVYVMRTGKVILEESGAALLARGQLWDLF